MTRSEWKETPGWASVSVDAGSVTVAALVRECPFLSLVSECGGVQAPPTLYDRALFPKLLAIADDSGGKMVAQANADLRVAVAFPASARRDLDATDEYLRARAEPPLVRP